MTASALYRWLAIALAALFASISLSAPASAQNYGVTNNRIRCESWQFRPARCNVPNTVQASIASVIAGDCRPGNWGFDRDGVFVNNGCRAIFNVASGTGGGFPGNPGGGWGGGNSGAGEIVRCESWQFQPARCPTDTRGGVRIQRVIAGNCRQNQTWGWDRRAVWVNGGCRADFITNNGNGGGNGGGGWGNSQIVECNSINYRPARCNTNIRSGVEIDRVLGGECIQNRTWGWDRGGIWVNNGCRARFRVF